MKKILMTLLAAFAMTAVLTSCEGTQELPPYNAPWVDPVGDGTVDNPYNCSAAVNKCKEIGDVASEEWYFVTGYVVGGDGIDTTYGNASFLLSDKEDGEGIFTVYRIKSYDNQKFTNANLIKKGDQITIYAPLINFKGNTPENNGGYLYALNGVVGGTPVEPVDPDKYPAVEEGNGTLSNPYNCAQIVKVCEETGETVTADKYYISGYVVGGTGIDTGYGNGTFLLADTHGGKGVFTAFRISDIGGAKFTDTNKVKTGDLITVYAPVVNFKGNTPETNYGELIKVVSNSDETETPSTPTDPTIPGATTPSGDGTAANPYNCAKAVEVAKQTGETATSQSYYIGGYVVGGSGIDLSYGNATFNLSDTKGGESTFMAFRIKDFGGEKFTDKSKVKEGDYIVVYAPIVNYKGNTPETNYGELVSINGKGNEGNSGNEGNEGGNQGGTATEGAGTLDNPYNVEQIIALAKATGTGTSEEVYFTGYVTEVKEISAQYGNATFYIADTPGGKTTFLIYRIKDAGGKNFTDENKVKVGQKVVIKSPVTCYMGNTPETVQNKGQLVSIDGAAARPSRYAKHTR